MLFMHMVFFVEAISVYEEFYVVILGVKVVLIQYRKK
jgi:hypothetical protein